MFLYKILTLKHFKHISLSKINRLGRSKQSMHIVTHVSVFKNPQNNK